MLWHCWQWSCMSNLYETTAACFTGPALHYFRCPHCNIFSLVIPPNLTAWPGGQSVTWAMLQLSTLATLHWMSATSFAEPKKKRNVKFRSVLIRHIYIWSHNTTRLNENVFISLWISVMSQYWHSFSWTSTHTQSSLSPSLLIWVTVSPRRRP